MIECFKKIFSKVLFVVLCSVTSMSICAQESLSLSNGKINILWEKHEGKWVMTLFEGKTPEGYKAFGRPSGKYNLIYDNVKPTIKPLAIVENGDTLFMAKTICNPSRSPNSLIYRLPSLFATLEIAAATAKGGARAIALGKNAPIVVRLIYTGDDK